jgi:hypothetical protein
VFWIYYKYWKSKGLRIYIWAQYICSFFECDTCDKTLPICLVFRPPFFLDIFSSALLLRVFIIIYQILWVCESLSIFWTNPIFDSSPLIDWDLLAILSSLLKWLGFLYLFPNNIPLGSLKENLGILLHLWSRW